jgi:hypothetical protein
MDFPLMYGGVAEIYGGVITDDMIEYFYDGRPIHKNNKTIKRNGKTKRNKSFKNKLYI